MTMPVFEEYEPAGDCVCLGCAQRRRTLARGRAITLRDGGHPAARGARRALVLATAAGVVLGGGGSAALAAAKPAPGPGPVALDDRDGKNDRDGRDGRDAPGSPQGGRAPLHGRPAPGPRPPSSPAGRPGAPPAVKAVDRATIINRAKLWLDAKVPYSMSEYWSDGYRQDCSGYVSMAWNLGTNEWTGSLDTFATKITKEELLPGDMLLFHNPADPNNGSHVVIFGGWVDETRTHYVAYEQTRPTTRKQATPYGYWKNSDKYLPYRYNGVTSGILPEEPVPGAPPAGTAVFPGAAKFGPGADNEYVSELGKMLVGRGGLRFYPKGPSTKWSDADQQATQAFQQAQGWTGADADGIPGEHTWRLLVQRQGKDIPPTGRTTPPGRPGPAGAPAYPGPGVFRPGQSHPAVTALGRQLAKKGFGKYYTSGPGPRWSEADRRNVEAFQRAQGWRGASANGYPGPETWRRLFA
ncbi:peptidoglycan-binding protein [Streptomyces sp. NBC_00091]|uniref:peptidoglycan-binding protein n=1 Tax=Streptomyces sp. NBC_00091 TaxID=2975648 RepID=UPI002253B4EF|nr:peptidoglycan-binding protein [Streptomyces sp. NBC_00091]MCX5378203.1 peptidoglycan-binding protein [Streptomyces sp. NBC_00091]